MLTAVTSSGSRLMMSTLKSWCIAANSSTACARAITSCTKGILCAASSLMRELDARQVVVNEVRSTGESEVVEEAVLDGGTDVVLSAGKQLHHRGSHQVSRAVAQHLESRLRRRRQWGACLGGVVDDLVWHARRILRSPPGTAPSPGRARISR